MDSLPGDVIDSIFNQLEYGSTIRMRRTCKLFAAASRKAEEASWARFVLSWGGSNILKKSVVRDKTRSETYLALKDARYLGMDFRDEDDDEYELFAEIIFNRRNYSNGNIFIVRLYCKDPIAEPGARPTAEMIRSTILAARPGVFQASFLEPLRVRDWPFMRDFLTTLAASGGVHSQDITPEVAFPHVKRFLSAVLDRPEENHDSDEQILEMSAKVTWFDIHPVVLEDPTPKFFAFCGSDEFFGAVLPDNRTMIYFMSTDF
eukprot:TRINITY_DN10783_c0_g1_i1.p1 TRINITY_DN10783_c0_g1~~TRINITY_DN10783_c0_g1_i1.p1  ORF type:complete len:270 (-),score=30.25 TRINITY_DN10783_c0_g1_i1:266-1048(-)